MQTSLTKLFCLLCTFIFLSVFAEEKVVAISLGDHCPVAQALRHHNIRTKAYPFDWVTTPFSGLYQLLGEDFANFFLKENLVRISPSVILDVYTGIQYTHDFPLKTPSFNSDQEVIPSGEIVDNFLDYYEMVNAKYWRRINRFRKMLNSSAKVIFIRHGATREQAKSLRDLLQIKYPHLDFTLAIINNDVTDLNLWNEQNIRFYYLSLHDLGNLESNGWLSILYDLQLLH